MNKELNELESFTVEEFQKDFDNLMNRIESGESFIITSEYGNSLIVPYKEVINTFEEVSWDTIKTVHLTSSNQTLILLGSTFKTMTLTSKFKKDIQTLRGAANGEFYLDVKNPKLFKKVVRYYENNGVVFSGDPEDDYEMLIDYLYEDLESVEVA